MLDESTWLRRFEEPQDVCESVLSLWDGGEEQRREDGGGLGEARSNAIAERGVHNFVFNNKTGKN